MQEEKERDRNFSLKCFAKFICSTAWTQCPRYILCKFYCRLVATDSGITLSPCNTNNKHVFLGMPSHCERFEDTFANIVEALGCAKFYVELSAYFPVNCYSAGTFRQIALNGTSKVLFVFNFLRRAACSWSDREWNAATLRETRTSYLYVYIYVSYFAPHYFPEPGTLIASDFFSKVFLLKV